MSEFTLEQCTIFTSCLLVGVFVGYKLKKPLKVLSNAALKEPTKLVLVVREDLKLGKGKLVSQCCHGTLRAYIDGKINNSKIVDQWEWTGQAKVVVKAKSLEEMMKIQKEATQIGLLTSLVQDAGRTQIAPGTETVLSVGPDRVSKIDSITGHLKLL